MNKKVSITIVVFASLLIAFIIGFFAGRASRYWDVRNAEDTVICVGWGNDQLRIEIEMLNENIVALQDSIKTLTQK